MNRPLLSAIAGFAVLGTTAVGAYVIASPGGEEEVVQQLETPTSVPSASATATTPALPTVSPLSSLPPIPPDWPTYNDPGGLFTVRYPSAWFQSAGQAQFSSYDLSTLTTTSRPPETIGVEALYYEAAGSSGCGGALTVDPKSGEGTPVAGAAPASLGGIPAWQIVRIQGDPAISEEDLTRIQGISVIYKGYCFLVTAYFTQQNSDVATFLQLASSFQFTF
jgi:hypothetical protein